eukprot:gene7517-11841_t
MLLRNTKRVIVGMSGGVDSSVSALLLKKQGYEVVGLFMKNWDENDESGNSECMAEKDWIDVKKVCEKIKIEHHKIEFIKEYWNDVFVPLIDEYSMGRTGNPDVYCNRYIKFGNFYEEALKKFEGEAIATGHYVQNDKFHLLKGKDFTKDQSYFLSLINGKKLEKSIFPIGHLMKSKVREIARNESLDMISEKRDSVGLCFIGKRNFKSFLGEFLPNNKGNFVYNGKVLGEHDGYQFYTIGQRAKISGLPEKYFVYGKNIEKNEVYICPGTDHPNLYSNEFEIEEPGIHWINENGTSEIIEPNDIITVKTRYNQTEATQCEFLSKTRIKLHTPIRAITEGQIAVFYKGERCLGGGIIKKNNL